MSKHQGLRTTSVGARGDGFPSLDCHTERTGAEYGATSQPSRGGGGPESEAGLSGNPIGGQNRHGVRNRRVMVRPGRPVVCLELWPGSPWSLLSVSVTDPEATAEWLHDRAPDLDPRGFDRSPQAEVWDWVADRLTLWPSP